jgi:hypothetical protein
MDRKLETIKSKLKLTRRVGHDQAIDALKYTWPALKLSLTVFQQTLNGVPIPGLQGAIGGFLALATTAEVCECESLGNAARILTTIQTSMQNSEDFLELQRQITKLNCIFKRWYGVHELPLELENRIKVFVKWVYSYALYIDILLTIVDKREASLSKSQLGAKTSRHAVLFSAFLRRQMMPANYQNS